MRPAVFLDRDGTLCRERGYLRDPERVELLPGAAEAVALLNRRGVLAVVISNQSGVARGLIRAEELERVNRRLEELLARQGARLDGIYCCPHGPEEGCECRKPRPGLAMRAARELGIDLRRSWVVGDKRSDLELARRLGARAVLVLTGYGRQTLTQVNAPRVARDLREAVDWILRELDAPAAG